MGMHTNRDNVAHVVWNTQPHSLKIVEFASKKYLFVDAGAPSWIRRLQENPTLKLRQGGRTSTWRAQHVQGFERGRVVRAMQHSAISRKGEAHSKLRHLFELVPCED